MKRLLSVGLVVGLCSCCSGVAGATELRTVALAGDFPAGTPKVLPVDAVALGDINNLGLTSLDTFDSIQPDFNFRRVWTEESGGLRLLVSEDDPAPLPESGIVFDDVFAGPTTEAGQTLIFGGLRDVDNSFLRAVWIEEAGSLHLVARDGGQVPGFADGVVFSFTSPNGFNAAGQVIVEAVLGGPGIDSSNNSAAFLGDTNSLRLVAQEGDQALGMPAGVNIAVVAPVDPNARPWGAGINDAGQSVLNVGLTDGTSSTPTSSAIYVEDAGSFRLVVKSGDPAPGTPDGVTFQSIAESTEPFGIDEAGQSAFTGFLEGPGVDATNNFGIWKETGDVASLVARAGDSAPGAEPGVTLLGNFRPMLDAGGHVTFTAGLTGPGVIGGSSGIWSDASGALELIVRTGDPAPGTADGVVFAGRLDLGQVNDAGQVSLVWGLTGEGVDNTNNVGIWATDPNGQLQLIARTGDELEVAPGVFRTVDFLGLRGADPDDEDITTGFNARGELAFGAGFTDGTGGIFVSKRVAIPEPSTWRLLLATALACTALAATRRVRSMES